MPATSNRTRKRPLFLVATIVLVVALGLLVWQFLQPEPAGAPSAYLIPPDGGIEVKTGWSSRRVDTPLGLRAGTSVHLEAGGPAWLLRSDGTFAPIEGPAELSAPEGTPTRALEFLFGDWASVTAADVSSLREPAGEIHITSPVGVTRFVDPTITWITREGVLYDVAVVDPADPAAPPRIVRGVRPPIAVSTLETTQRPELPPDRIFGVIVRETANQTVIGASQFLTSPDAAMASLPTSAPELLREAVSALTITPARTGDAWVALNAMPETWRNSELGLRLRWKAATELHLGTELERLRGVEKPPTS